MYQKFEQLLHCALKFRKIQSIWNVNENLIWKRPGTPEVTSSIPTGGNFLQNLVLLCYSLCKPLMPTFPTFPNLYLQNFPPQKTNLVSERAGRGGGASKPQKSM